MEDLITPEATRRPRVDACQIRLADKRLWGFARPTMRLIPVVIFETDSFGRIDEAITARAETSYSLPVCCALDELATANAEYAIQAQYEAFFGLAVGLLGLAHEICEDTARALLSVERSEIPRLVDEVLAVATGRS